MGETAPVINNAETLKKIFYDINNAASFSNVERLYHAVEKKISRQQIKKWLSAQLSYSLHKPRRINFARNHYEVTNINDQWQMDLADLASLSEENDNYKYVLLTIDSFSKYIHLRPLKTKKASEVLDAFKSIVEEAGHAPLQLITDRGKEFLNNQLSAYLKSIETRHYAPSNDTFKAAIAERAIRTFKGLLYKMLTASFNLRYINSLQQIAASINARKHSTINMPPKDVNSKNILKVWEYVNARRKKALKKKVVSDIKVGDYVRVSKNKMTNFDKAFLPNWTDEIFKVVKHVKRTPQVFRLEDNEGEILEGSWYRPELQPVEKNSETIYRINEVLKRRTRRGVKEIFVSWKGFSKKYNSWILVSDLVENE